MSDVANAVAAEKPAKPVPEWPRTLRRIRNIGSILIGVQFVAFMAWSALLYNRFAVTPDYATYHQAWYLIAHGNFDPLSTILGFSFWRSDSEFMPWLLAPIYWLWPHDLLFQWAQDASIAGAEFVAFTWLCEVAKDKWHGKGTGWLAVTGLVALLANPWTWWAVSFDVHEETLVVVFVVLLARDLTRGRRRAWLWVAPILAGGAPSATYVIGLGLCGVAASRRSRASGLVMACVGVAYSLFIVLIHGDMGVPLAPHYGYLVNGGASDIAIPNNITIGDVLKGAVLHPSGVYNELWQKKIDIWANIGPAGLIGLLSPLVMPAVLVVLLADALSPGYQFAEPLFQNIPVYVLLPVGTVAVLCWIARRHRRLALLTAGVVAAQILGWAVVWAPRTPHEWLRVSSRSAATLASIESRIPNSAQVIASQGVLGRFSGRTHVQPLLWPGPIHLYRGETWIIIAPSVGIETLRTASAMWLVQKLAGSLHAQLMFHANGVWAFRWYPPANMHTLRVPAVVPALRAWGMAGAAGRSDTRGPARSWHVTSTGGRGYVVDRLEWRQPPGHYQVIVDLSTSKAINAEVWNNTSNQLLARRTIGPTRGVVPVGLSVDATRPYRNTRYSGWGLFHADFVPPAPGERLELRVWSPGSAHVNVYSARITEAGHATGVSRDG